MSPTGAACWWGQVRLRGAGSNGCSMPARMSSSLRPKSTPTFASCVAGRGEIHRPRVRSRPMSSASLLVIAATNDAAVNRAVHAAATKAGVLVNTVDDVGLSSVIFPSIVNRDPVIVAVSTGGRSPTLARRVRSLIEARLPSRLGTAADVVGALAFARSNRRTGRRVAAPVLGRVARRSCCERDVRRQRRSRRTR